MAKYAKVERERRFLVPEMPSNLGLGTPIHDRYLQGTRIRLRRMGDRRKLTQKIPEGPSRCLITTFYLDDDEYARFAVLPAWELRKTRYPVEHEGRAWGVDVFEGPLHGLVLAEIELTGEGEVVLPPFVEAEVTEDERFAGGWLARYGMPPTAEKGL